MYKRIDFTQLGGFPATQYTLDYMQDAFSGICGALAALVGDKVILSGMTAAGDQTTAGWVCLNGEILPFIAGPTTATIVIVETNEARAFGDGSTKTVYYKRVATFGAGAGAINFSDLVRVGTIKDIFYGQCPIGSVIPYEGDPAALPSGWVMHELIKGRVLIGKSDTDPDYETLGTQGGSKVAFINQPNLPAIQLRLTSPFGGAGFYVNDTGGGGGEQSLKGDGGNGTGNGFVKTEMLGAGTGISVVQPYYVIGFIKKIA